MSDSLVLATYDELTLTRTKARAMMVTKQFDKAVAHMLHWHELAQSVN